MTFETFWLWMLAGCLGFWLIVAEAVAVVVRSL